MESYPTDRLLENWQRLCQAIGKDADLHHGDLARFSEHGEDLLFRMFGVAAELLIDHAWGYESCTMQAIKSYQPKGHSISQGQVLPCPYDFEKGRLIVREMTELLVLDLVRKKMVADQIVLMVGYDHTGIPETYRGELKKTVTARKSPKPHTVR